MKSISPALAAHFGEDCTSLAVLWKLTTATGMPEANPPSYVVQAGTATNIFGNYNATLIAVTFPRAATVGNTIVVSVSLYNWATLDRVYDNLGDTFTQAAYGTNSGAKWSTWLYYYQVTTPGITTIFIGASGHGGNDAAQVGVAAEMTNFYAPIATDGVASGSGSRLSPLSTGTITTTHANDIVFSNIAGGGSFSGGTPPEFTLIGSAVTSIGSECALAYQLASQVGTFNPIWSGTQGQVGNTVAFRLQPVSLTGSPPSAPPLVKGFTTHDQSITYEGVTYAPDTGMTNTAIAKKLDLSVDNLETTAFLNSDSISEADLRAGVYDWATVEIRIVNWADLTMGDLKVVSGLLGQVVMKNGVFTAEIRGLTQQLTTVIGNLYGPICRAELYSGLNGIDMNSRYLCMVDLMAFQQTGLVATSVDAVSIVPLASFSPPSPLLMKGSTTPTLPAGPGWFNDGTLTFTSGAMNGYTIEIKSYDGETLTTFLPMPFQPVVGDSFTIEPGCNHAKTDCYNKFVNIENFRGEPDIPGNDILLNDYVTLPLGNANPTAAPTPLVASGALNGAIIPYGYGTYRFAGNLIWSPGLVLDTDFQNTTYWASFACAFGEGPGDVVKIWFDTTVVYDITSGTNTAFYVPPGDDNKATLYPVPRFYQGTQTQLPDPLIQAAVGVNACSAFRPLIYIVYERLFLLNFGNRIPNIQALIQYKEPWTYGENGIVGSAIASGVSTENGISTVETVTNQDNTWALGLLTTKCGSTVTPPGWTPITFWGTGFEQGYGIIPTTGSTISYTCPNLFMGSIGWTSAQWCSAIILFSGPPTFVQFCGGSDTYTAPFTSNLTAGNAVLVICQSPRSTTCGGGFTVTDSQGNNYEEVVYAESGPGYIGNAYLGVYIAYNVQAGPDTVTISPYGGTYADFDSACIEMVLTSSPQTWQTAIIPGVLGVDSGAATGWGNGGIIGPTYTGESPSSYRGTGIQTPTDPLDWALMIVAGNGTITPNPVDGAHDWHTFDTSLAGYGCMASFMMSPAEANLDVTNTTACATTSGTGDWAAAVFSFSDIGYEIPKIIQKVCTIAPPLAMQFTSAFSLPTTNNNTIIVVQSILGLTGNNDAFASLSDTQGNAYHQVHVHNNSVELDVWIIQNIAAAPNAFTVILQNTGTSINTTAYEIQGGAYPSANLSTIVTDICERAGLTSDQIDVTQIQGLPVTGYMVTSQGDAKSALGPPLQANFVDAVESDFKLKFVPRGENSSVMTIPESDLGLEKDNSELKETIIQAQELPKEVDVSFIDPNINFQQNTSQKLKSSRVAKSKQVVSMNINMLMTATQARAIAEKALNLAYIESRPFDFNLWKMAYSVLDPTDVIQFVYEGITYQVRVVTTELGVDYSYKLTTVSDSDNAYHSIAAPVPSGIIPQSGATAAPSVTFLFDIPYLQDGDASVGSILTGFYWGLTSASTSWPSGSLFKSPDDVTFSQFASTNQQMIYGTCVNTLGNPPYLWAWDTVNTLNITPLYGTLSSATDLAVLNGANTLIVGGEVIQFADATLNEDASYTISRLLRGRRNTEYAAYGHSSEESVIAPLTGLQHATSALSSIGVEQYFRGVTTGTDPTTVIDTDLTLAGNDLKPACPVHLTGARDGSNNLTIGWTRRTRYAGDWLENTGYVPLNEAAELYTINIMNGLTVKRTINWTSGYDGNGNPTASYTAAQQTTDGFTPGNPISVVIYQFSEQVGNGFPGAVTI